MSTSTIAQANLSFDDYMDRIRAEWVANLPAGYPDFESYMEAAERAYFDGGEPPELPNPAAPPPEPAPAPAADDGDDGDDENPFGEGCSDEFLTDIESRTSFWDRTPQLQHIAWRAFQEDISAWGVLAACMASRVAAVDPTRVLVKISGQPGDALNEGTSANMFVALVAPAGTGKSAVMKEASSIIPPRSPRDVLPSGTGQGFIKAFVETETVVDEEDTTASANGAAGSGAPAMGGGAARKKGTKRERIRFKTHHVFVQAPEIEQLNAEFERQGSATASMMRQLWMGEGAGNTTGERDRRTNLPANLYRFCGIWGAQPSKANAIIADAAGGTPQRFLWAPSAEWRGDDDDEDEGGAPLVRTPPPGPVTFPMPVWNPGAAPYGTSGSQLPDVIEDGVDMPDPVWIGRSPVMQTEIPILRAKHRRVAKRNLKKLRNGTLTKADKREEQRAEMESHFILCRIKVAVALAWLHGRCEPTDLDWELSETVMEVSRRVLADCWLHIRESNTDRQKGISKERATVKHLSGEEEARLYETLVKEGAAIVLNSLRTNGPAPRRYFQRTALPVRFRDKRLLGDIFVEVEESGLVELVDMGRKSVYRHIHDGTAA